MGKNSGNNQTPARGSSTRLLRGQVASAKKDMVYFANHQITARCGVSTEVTRENLLVEGAAPRNAIIEITNSTNSQLDHPNMPVIEGVARKSALSDPGIENMPPLVRDDLVSNMGTTQQAVDRGAVSLFVPCGAGPSGMTLVATNAQTGRMSAPTQFFITVAGSSAQALSSGSLLENPVVLGGIISLGLAASVFLGLYLFALYKGNEGDHAPRKTV